MFSELSMMRDPSGQNMRGNGAERRGSVMSTHSKAKDMLKRNSIVHAYTTNTGGAVEVRDGGGGTIGAEQVARAARKHGKTTKPPVYKDEDVHSHAPVVKKSWNLVMQRLGYFPLANLYYDIMEEEMEMRHLIENGDRCVCVCVCVYLCVCVRVWFGECVL